MDTGMSETDALWEFLRRRSSLCCVCLWGVFFGVVCFVYTYSRTEETAMGLCVWEIYRCFIEAVILYGNSRLHVYICVFLGGIFIRIYAHARV